MFAEQLKFLDDTAKLKAGFCTRRAGKSEMCAYALIIACLSAPNTDVLYLGLTRSTAKNVMWRRKLYKILQKHNIPFLPNKTELSITFENNSVITLSGADSDRDSLDKLLGSCYKLVIIDEAQSFGNHLRTLIYDTLKPAVAETGGIIMIIGTPGDIPAGFFFDVTNSYEKTYRWSVHSWSWSNNPHVVKPILKELQEAEENNPYFKSSPTYQRQWCGKWVVEDNWRVYQFNTRNYCQTFPRSSDWAFILGVDLGWNDSSAFVLTAFCSESPNLFIISVEKHKFMDLGDVAAKIKWFQERYVVVKTVIDSANKQGVETMKNRFQLHNVDPAEKVAKVAFIETLNSDLRNGFVSIAAEHVDAVKPLLEEAYQLQWDRTAYEQGKKLENPKCENHLLDAFLYNWRAAKHYLGSVPQLNQKPLINSLAYWNALEEEQIEERTRLLAEAQEIDALLF